VTENIQANASRIDYNHKVFDLIKDWCYQEVAYMVQSCGFGGGTNLCFESHHSMGEHYQSADVDSTDVNTAVTL
jgi:hypothetical protein